MPLPSVKTLSAVFGDRAKEARELLEMKRKTRDYASVRDWEAQCCNPPSYTERLFCALNEIGDFYGVEAVFSSNDACRPVFEYLNTGGSYEPTLIYNTPSGTWQVGTWGDKVEALERRGVRFN